MWVGGYRTGSGNDFEWEDGSSWDYDNWAYGQPDNLNGNQDHVLIHWSGSMWDDSTPDLLLICLFADYTSPTAVPSMSPTIIPTTAPSIEETVAPSASPSMEETVAPSFAPTILESMIPTEASIICEDSPLLISHNGGSFNCNQVKLGGFCDVLAAQSHCPVTCNACDAYACENSMLTWIVGTQTYTCDVLNQLPPQTVEAYCNVDYASILPFTCRASCGVCSN